MAATSVYTWVGLIATVLASAAAWKSAGIAKEAQKQARDEGRRRLFREAQMGASRVVSTSLEVDDIADRMKTEAQSLGVNAHATGSERINRFVEGADEKKRRAAVLAAKATKWRKSNAVLGELTEDALTGYVVEFDRDKTNIVRLVGELSRNLEDLQSSNRWYLDRALGRQKP